MNGAKVEGFWRSGVACARIESIKSEWPKGTLTYFCVPSRREIQDSGDCGD